MARTSVQAGWLLVAGACLLFGGVLGYVVATSPSAQRSDSLPSPVPGAAAPLSSVVDEQQIRTYRAILKQDPTNVQAAVQLGNLLYDAGRYGEAVEPYRQAFVLDPRNINVSTDLGTALWYSGRPDEALAQYEKSLAIQPGHAQTLFNVGIVKRDGKRDPHGAKAAWELLLKDNPGYPERNKVQQAIEELRDSSAEYAR